VKQLEKGKGEHWLGLHVRGVKFVSHRGGNLKKVRDGPWHSKANDKGELGGFECFRPGGWPKKRKKRQPGRRFEGEGVKAM